VSDENAPWKTSRTCGCGASATVGFSTCARCRVRALAARLVPELDVSRLDEAQAICVERSLRAAEDALRSARAVIAVSLGAPTHERPVGEDREVVLGRGPEGASAPGRDGFVSLLGFPSTEARDA
jgi:hypothetical protein